MKHPVYNFSLKALPICHRVLTFPPAATALAAAAAAANLRCLSLSCCCCLTMASWIEVDVVNSSSSQLPYNSLVVDDLPVSEACKYVFTYSVMYKICYFK